MSPGRREHPPPAQRRELPIDRRPEMLADSRARTRRGLIRLIATAIVAVALVVFLVWFFAFAHNPCCAP